MREAKKYILDNKNATLDKVEPRQFWVSETTIDNALRIAYLEGLMIKPNHEDIEQARIELKSLLTKRGLQADLNG